MSDNTSNQPMTRTGAAIKNDDIDGVRIKTGDQLIPKTTFRPIAAPHKLFGNKAESAEELMGRNKMKLYEDLLRIFVAAKKPITLWGPVGAGKTRTVESFRKETDENGVPYNVITIQPSTIDPSSLHGLLTIEKDPRTGAPIMYRAIPDPAQQVWDAFNDKDQLTVMFLDEMTTCTPAQQQALLGLLTHGQYGDLNINPYVTFAMAANPPGTVDAVMDLEQSVINRGGHIPWYTEPDIFLSKWSSGFGNPAKAPDRVEQDFARLLIDSDRDIAFRDDPDHYESEDEMWTVDKLCPFDRMTFSSRILTESVDVFTLIRKTFPEAPYDVRKLYVQEAIQALCGPRWGKNAGQVYDFMESQESTEKSIDAINKYKIDNSMTHEQVVNMVGDTLHRIKGEKMDHRQEESLAEKFEEEIFYDGFRVKVYRAFWLWLATSTSEQRRENVIPIALRILIKAKKVAGNEMSGQETMPAFVPKKILEEIEGMTQRFKDMRKAHK